MRNCLGWLDDQAIKVATWAQMAAGFLLYTRHKYARLPEELKSVDAAPLVCAGITTFNALRNAGRAGDTVAIQGIGGLGHPVVLGRALWRLVDRPIRAQPPQCSGPNRWRCRLTTILCP
jgi:Zn-dependent alcohol dehydrogenase